MQKLDEAFENFERRINQKSAEGAYGIVAMKVRLEDGMVSVIDFEESQTIQVSTKLQRQQRLQKKQSARSQN